MHFHIRWGATYKQQPFVVRNCAVVGSPKLGIVNHGGYGLVDDNVTYKVRGSHFFTENGSEIGRFKGNLAVRSHGTGFDTGDDDGMPIPRKYAYHHPLNIGHGGHGFWLQGGGVDVTDNVSIGHSYSAFGFFVANNRIVTYGGPQEPNNPLTKGTRWERLDVFLAENLKDPSLAHGKPFAAHQCRALPHGPLRRPGFADRPAHPRHRPHRVPRPARQAGPGRGLPLRLERAGLPPRLLARPDRTCATRNSSAATRPRAACTGTASAAATTSPAS